MSTEQRLEAIEKNQLRLEKKIDLLLNQKATGRELIEPVSTRSKSLPDKMSKGERRIRQQYYQS